MISYVFLFSQAKFFEEQMAALFGGAGAPGEAPTAEQFNLGFQKMAGMKRNWPFALW